MLPVEFSKINTIKANTKQKQVKKPTNYYKWKIIVRPFPSNAVNKTD